MIERSFRVDQQQKTVISKSDPKDVRLASYEELVLAAENDRILKDRWILEEQLKKLVEMVSLLKYKFLITDPNKFVIFPIVQKLERISTQLWGGDFDSPKAFSEELDAINRQLRDHFNLSREEESREE